MKRDRWYIRNVDEDVISFVQDFAKENGMTNAGVLRYFLPLQKEHFSPKVPGSIKGTGFYTPMDIAPGEYPEV